MLKVVARDGEAVRSRLELLRPAFSKVQSFACWLFSLSGGVIMVGGLTLAAWTIVYSPERRIYGSIATLACIWLAFRWASSRLGPQGEGVQHIVHHHRRFF